MSKPKVMNLKKMDQKKVLGFFNGNKKRSPIRNARKIAEMTDLPHRQVMLFLEQERLTSYSDSSYS